MSYKTSPFTLYWTLQSHKTQWFSFHWTFQFNCIINTSIYFTIFLYNQSKYLNLSTCGIAWSYNLIEHKKRTELRHNFLPLFWVAQFASDCHIIIPTQKLGFKRVKTKEAHYSSLLGSLGGFVGVLRHEFWQRSSCLRFKVWKRFWLHILIFFFILLHLLLFNVYDYYCIFLFGFLEPWVTKHFVLGLFLILIWSNTTFLLSFYD